MAKTIIKEMIISLLLCLAIILALGILLYEYVPMSKTIPSPVSYTTPETVRQELAEAEGVDEERVIMTYEVDMTDLNNYKKIQNYKPGKANPFSSFEVTETNGTNTTTGNSAKNSGTTEEGKKDGNPTTAQNQTNDMNNTNSTNSSTQESTNQTTTSGGGQFFQDKGTK